MNIYHILKKSGYDSEFRDIILSFLNSLIGINKLSKEIKVYIASGFFNQTNQHSPHDLLFFKSPHLNVDLITCLQNLNVEIFGAFYGKKDLLNIKNILQQRNVSHNIYYKHRFHSKLFVVTIDSTPVIEIIGSSNMTKPAYNGMKYPIRNALHFSENTESDLVIYNEGYISELNDLYGSHIPATLETSMEVIAFKYDEHINNNISFENRMNYILNYIEDLKQGMQLL